MAEEKNEAFGKGLIPYVAFEVVCLIAGLAARFMTGEVLWLLLAVVVGGAPLALYIVRNSQKSGKR